MKEQTESTVPQTANNSGTDEVGDVKFTEEVDADNSPKSSGKVVPIHRHTQLKKGFKIGRNAPCPCGSGMKYKKCCWLKQVQYEQIQRELKRQGEESSSTKEEEKNNE